MKLFAKKIFNSKLLLFLRNNLNIKKNKFDLFNIKKNISVSDSFCWRTDKDFETIFRFSDILKNFYKIDKSKIIIIFYDKQGKFLKEILLDNLKQSENEIKIDKSFFNNLEDYGTFHVYHISNIDIKEKLMISNRCYVGYSKKKALPSFMHGNTYSSYAYINNHNIKYSNIVKNKILTNSIYKIQNYFDGYDRTELFFSNPTDQKIKFYLNGRFYELYKNESFIIETKTEKIFTIKSNCLFLRPTIFSYKDKYLDVHHS